MKDGLVFFQDVGMSLKNLAQRTREEYSRDVTDLIEFLEARGLTELYNLSFAHL